MPASTPSETNAKAPDFELPEAWAGTVRLSKLCKSGPVVLIFYPSDWGWVCNSEMKEFKERQPEFSVLGARLVGIGTNSLISHRAWKEHLGLDFPILSDFDGEVTRLYGVLDLSDGFNRGRSKRAVIIVDQDQTVVYRWVTENHWLEPDYDEVTRSVRILTTSEKAASAKVPMDAMADSLDG